MSSRNVRKLAEKLQLASLKNKPEIDKETEDETEDEHFEPLYAGKLGSVYAGLVISSSSNTDADDSSCEKENAGDEVVAPVVQKKKNKNNRKKRNKNKNAQAGPSGTRALVPVEVDEVAKVVAEVNQMLGEPEMREPPPEAPARSTQKTSQSLLKIDHKHLNVHNELTRMFGPEEEDGRPRPKPRLNIRLLRRQIIMTNYTYNFTTKGLSMNLIDVRDGVKFFKFEHGPEYQRNMHTLVKAMKLHYDNYIRAQDYEVYPSKTVEALIENLDLYFNLDEASIASNALEQAIFFMQSVFDPAFNYLDGKTRLEYKYVENRTFHIALLKYLHILTNKACHRTALELAKLLLNLDPSDPLGVIFIMDTLALRAREHQWLVDIFNYHWSNEKDATRLFHLRYSHALATYHLYLKTKKNDDLQEANNLLKYALVKYPNVAVLIMSLCKRDNADIMNHEMFTTQANNTTSTDLLNLQMLYAKFVWPKWREQQIMDWVTANALVILALYKNDPNTKAKIKKGGEERSQLFRKYPLEIKRHLSSISAMSNLLVDGAVPAVEKTLSFNPYPDKGVCVDVHRYYKDWGVVYPEETPRNNRGLLRTFIDSLVPEAGNQPENGGG